MIKIDDLIGKIIQGDCLEVMQDIPDKSIDMILCDLPYGTTACSWDIVIDFDLLWSQYKRIAKDNACICLFGSQPFTTDLINSNREWYKYLWYWNKIMISGALLAKKQPLRIIEEICIFYKKQYKYNPLLEKLPKSHIRKNNIVLHRKSEVYDNNFSAKRHEYRKIPIDMRYPFNLIKFSKRGNKKYSLHPSEKPVALFEYLIKTYTDENDIVLDNCIGSGTTAVACIKTGRKYIGIEKEKKYCDICNKRIREAKESISLLTIAEQKEKDKQLEML